MTSQPHKLNLKPISFVRKRSRSFWQSAVKTCHYSLPAAALLCKRQPGSGFTVQKGRCWHQGTFSKLYEQGGGVGRGGKGWGGGGKGSHEGSKGCDWVHGNIQTHRVCMCVSELCWLGVSHWFAESGLTDLSLLGECREEEVCVAFLHVKQQNHCTTFVACLALV